MGNQTENDMETGFISGWKGLVKQRVWRYPYKQISQKQKTRTTPESVFMLTWDCGVLGAIARICADRSGGLFRAGPRPRTNQYHAQANSCKMRLEVSHLVHAAPLA